MSFDVIAKPIVSRLTSVNDTSIHTTNFSLKPHKVSSLLGRYEVGVDYRSKHL